MGCCVLWTINVHFTLPNKCMINIANGFLLTKINFDSENSFYRRSFQYFTLYFWSEKCFWMAQETWINGFDAHANSTLNSCFVTEYSMVFLKFCFAFAPSIFFIHIVNEFDAVGSEKNSTQTKKTELNVQSLF